MGFPGGPVVKNLPCNEMVWKMPHAVVQLNCVPPLLTRCSRAHEPQLLKPCSASLGSARKTLATAMRSPLDEKPTHAPREQPSLPTTRESPCAATKTTAKK